MDTSSQNNQNDSSVKYEPMSSAATNHVGSSGNSKGEAGEVPNDPGKMFIGGLSWQTTTGAQGSSVSQQMRILPHCCQLQQNSALVPVYSGNHSAARCGFGICQPRPSLPFTLTAYAAPLAIPDELRKPSPSFHSFALSMSNFFRTWLSTAKLASLIDYACSDVAP
ncbi:unnamed protein product [Cyprideis torosa]|uniref:Uncharacterized protein n=1 Tax=Cyprideis torosa TaxID=163714 RepID=A0A7R8W1Z4_9CRUS|nr:unnamed protein product [Cyprideis torosa]CAG0881341.1 unnamed protein product [Cyprideis torosa]